MSAATTPSTPNPAIIFETLNAYQRSAALKTAIELDLFTQIAHGHQTVEALSGALNSPARGVRILCDFLVVGGFLTKSGNQYALTPESSLFLNRESPAYFGGIAHFLLDPRLIAPYLDLTAVVQTGTTTLPAGGTVSHDNPIWVAFARHMAPMVYPAAQEMAALTAREEATRVLDIAAGHGLFGIMVAQTHPKAQIVALDWPNVLAVAEENAKRFGVAERLSLLPGSAFEADYGGPYDMVLVPNFFHHFDQPTCESLMRKFHAALSPGGRCVTVEFVPNEDRVTPPVPAAFAMMMLGTTPAGDAYTFAEFQTMFQNAGFASSERHALQKSPETVIVSRKA